MLAFTRTALTASLAALAFTMDASSVLAAETTLRNPLASGATLDTHVAQSRTDGRWTVCAVPVSQTNCDGGNGAGFGFGFGFGNIRTRIDFRITLPGGVNFEARDVGGKITVRNTASDVDAKSVSGDVHVTTSGSARVATVFASVSGDVTGGPGDATVGRGGPPIGIETVSGSIFVKTQ